MTWDDERKAEREQMAAEQLAARGIVDSRVLAALRLLPRHRFMPSTPESQLRAYADGAQPIGEGQTISQPFIVALMTQALALSGEETVLEIGAGSGYQTAVLCLLCREVIAIERHAPLAARARRILDELELTNYRLIVGDGSQGWPSQAPYDAILIAAVAPQLPIALQNQLKPGGRIVLPVGPEGGEQHLLLLTKAEEGTTLTAQNLGAVSFVPLIGVAGFGIPDDLGAVE